MISRQYITEKHFFKKLGGAIVGGAAGGTAGRIASGNKNAPSAAGAVGTIAGAVAGWKGGKAIGKHLDCKKKKDKACKKFKGTPKYKTCADKIACPGK